MPSLTRPFIPILLPVLALLALALPVQAAEPVPGLSEDAPQPLLAPAPEAAHMDKDLVREYERFTQFAQDQMQRMNANIIGGKNNMQVRKEGEGLYKMSYKAIDIGGMVCQVRRASDPRYFVGTVIYKEQVLECVSRTAENCRKGPFEPVSEKPFRIIYSSRLGGGWAN